ncbi:MAG TPA: DUF535 family protein, partial [Burkholderiaceae bacterium]|nr:DUF535 family protein [Burkholderiaceae bacterium]
MQFSSYRSQPPSSLSASLWMYFRDVANTDLRQMLASAVRTAPHNARVPIRLLSCIASTRRGLPYIKEWVKLGARSRLNYRETLRWVPFWNSSPLLRELARAKPHALQKIYRPYLNDRFDCSQRLSIITGHYAFMLAHGFGPLLLRAARQPVTLCEISGKSGDVYQVQLAAVGTLEREGELVLRLCSQGEELYSIAYTFCVDGTSASIAVGCLQGPRSADSLERIRKATRDLHGMRPKSMMVRLV